MCNKKIKKLVLVIITLTSLQGCPHLNPENSWLPGSGGRVSTAGASQLISANFENIDLIHLLDPKFNSSEYQECNAIESEELKEGCKLDVAFKAFNSELNISNDAAEAYFSLTSAQKKFDATQKILDDAEKEQEKIQQNFVNASTQNAISNTPKTKKNLKRALEDKKEIDAEVEKKKSVRESAKDNLDSIKKRAAANVSLIIKRNAIQNKIIAASDQRCNAYLNYMQRSYSETNFTLGFLTTALGGIGAIVPGVSAARALSGVAGIMSGSRAEFSQDFFYNQTVSLIVTGITQARKAVLSEIEDETTGRGINSDRPYIPYPVEMAIADAIRYHGSCTLAKGIEQLAKLSSYEFKPSPVAGLDQFKKVVVPASAEKKGE